MNVVYSSDETYVQHMAVSMLSLFETNSSTQELNVFVISNEITERSRGKLTDLASSYNRRIHWIEFGPFRDSLVLDMEWPISISAYARLFLAEMLPDWCDRVIYLDCDTVVDDSLEDLWTSDMKGCAVAGVKDLIDADFKKCVGLSKDDIYVNSGVLLVDLMFWRNTRAQTRFVEFINQHNGRVTHHDQGVINGVLKQNIHVLAPRYNTMTPFFTNQYDRMLRFYGLKNYYSKQELDEAVSCPAIIHYTPELVGRVWEIECSHPKAEIYRQYLSKTVWAGNLVHAQPLSPKMKLLHWMYRNLPVPLLNLILRRNRC